MRYYVSVKNDRYVDYFEVKMYCADEMKVENGVLILLQAEEVILALSPGYWSEADREGNMGTQNDN